MNIGNLFLTVFIIMQLRYYYGLFSPSNRKKIVNKNIELNKLRKIPVKSLEDQKKFLDLKYPKNNKKFDKKKIGYFFIEIGCFIVLFSFITLQTLLYNINVNIFTALLIIILFPILSNYILKKFNINKDDLSIWFK